MKPSRKLEHQVENPGSIPLCFLETPLLFCNISSSFRPTIVAAQTRGTPLRKGQRAVLATPHHQLVRSRKQHGVPDSSHFRRRRTRFMEEDNRDWRRPLDEMPSLVHWVIALIAYPLFAADRAAGARRTSPLQQIRPRQQGLPWA